MQRLDIVVLGATGFSGTLVVKCLAKLSVTNLKWGIAGRSKEKLCNLIKDIQNIGRGGDISNIPVIIADASKNEELDNVANQAKILLNCVGPNTIYSDRIVQACLKSGTHYIDISAEINHILDLHRNYHIDAENSKVLIIPSCGFASLIAASGLLYLEEQFEGTLSTVECYAVIDVPKRAYLPWPGNCLVHYGTWESMVHVMKNMKKYQRLKQETFPQPLLEKDHIKRCFFHRHNGKFWIPYPGPEKEVIEMSERYRSQKSQRKPINFKAYVTMPCFFHFIIVPIFLLYYYLCYFTCFTKLLLKFPRLFTAGYMSHKGPSEKMMKSVKYSFTLIGKGWDKSVADMTTPPCKSLTAKVSSCDGYAATAYAMVAAALTLHSERNKMPEGGVVQVGAVFIGTDLVRRLMEYNLNYELLLK